MYHLCAGVCDRRTKTARGKLFEAFISWLKKMSPTQADKKESITGTREPYVALPAARRLCLACNAIEHYKFYTRISNAQIMSAALDSRAFNPTRALEG